MNAIRGYSGELNLVFFPGVNVLTSKCLLKLIYIDTCLFDDLVFFYTYKAKDVHIIIDMFI